jgi:hypothetical protein
MTYSLVNMAAVVRDLARLPAGSELALDLLHAFTLTSAGYDELDAQAFDTEARNAVMAQAGQPPRALAVLAAARAGAEEHGLASYAGALDLLSDATLGGIDDLMRFLRREVMAAAWSGDAELSVSRHGTSIEVVTDGLVATYVGTDTIGSSWRRWCAGRAVVQPPAACALVVDAVRLIGVDADPGPVPSDWAAHMHAACWATYLTGRGRDTAVAQLHALRALVDGASGVAAPRHGLVATVVAAVHASMVADLLADETVAAMTDPFFRLLP